MNVTVVGLGKLGSCLAAVLAEAGHTVKGIDLNSGYVDAINNRKAPVQETGLQELLDHLPEGRLTATTDYAEALDGSQISMIVVPTPSDEKGEFSNEYVLQAVRGIGPNITENWHTVVVCSTVMPGSTAGVILPELERVSKRVVGRSVGLCYSPEFIALGSVIRDMKNPDMILVGAEDARSIKDLDHLTASYLPYECPVRTMGYTEAELAKIAINTYITMKISYANTIGVISDALGVSVDRVLNGVGGDSRIGHKYLRSGASYGGPCFPRDTVAFAALGRSLDVPTYLADATDMVNEYIIATIAQKLIGHNDIAILGTAYKPNTVVTEESMGRKLILRLQADGTRVLTHDPVAQAMYADAQRCVDMSSAVVIATAYPEYASIDYGDRLVIDPWGVRK